MRFAWVVYRKELLDGIRDRRSIYSMLFSSVAGMLLIGLMFSRIASLQRGAQEITVPVAGAEHAPVFVEWLKQQSGVEVTRAPGDPEEAVRSGKQDFVVIIDKDFGRNFNRSMPASIKLVNDSSRDTARAKVRRARQLLQAYSAEIATLRLISHGVSPVIAVPLRVEDVEVSSAQQRAALVLSFIPMFIVLASMVGGMQLATDSTAGERERGSIEPLLLNPVPRRALAAGKWLAASTFAAVNVVLTSALCLGLLEYLPLHELSVRFRIDPRGIAGVLAVTMPAALLASALQVFVATFARSFKEAQMYLSILIMVTTLPGVLTRLYPVSDQRWMALIPIFGQYAMLNDLLGGKMPSAILFLSTAAITLLLAAGFVELATKLLHRERIIFGR
ncbi:MAG: ABC transporter permease [Bryobacteraceae bacterium]